jgi:gluconolactonase
MKSTAFLFAAILFAACAQKTNNPGSIEFIDPELNALIKKDAVVEVIAEGFDWSEGPLWFEKQQMLIFSDVPTNTIYKWSADKGKQIYLAPSGFTGTEPRGGEKGSNGLTVSNDGKLLLAQHGDRRIAMMNAPIDSPKPNFTTVAASYQGKKFNSPNDLVVSKNGTIFFTDPPYGLEKNMDDPKKEIPWQGVYKITADGSVTLLVDSLTRPNGIAFTPDEKSLIIANSDSAGNKRIWYKFDVTDSLTLANGRVMYDVSNEKLAGSPDGLKIDRQGNIFASGPDGIWIFNKNEKLIGKIRISAAVSNCAFSEDQKVLFITADMYVLKVKMRE